MDSKGEILIYQSKDKNSVCAKIAHTALDGKAYTIEFYNVVNLINKNN